MRWGRVLALVAVIAVAVIVAKPLVILAAVGLVGWLAFGYATGRFSK